MLKRPRHDPQQQQAPLDATLRQGPLAIPELIELIGQCLDLHSLTMCIRVCHLWHRALRHQVWQVVVKYLAGSTPPDSKKSNGPSLSLLRKYAGFVEKLFLKIHNGKVGFPGRHPIYCPWLTELTVVTTGFQEPDHIKNFLEEKLAPFVMEHRATLKKLVLRVTQSEALTEAMVSCERLECLVSRVPYLGQGQELDGWMNWYESQGSRLKSLTLLGPRITQSRTGIVTEQTMQTLLSSASVSSLQSLDMRVGGPAPAKFGFLMLLVMKSPKLKKLSWPALDNGAITRIAKAFEKNRSRGLFCQQLESLSIWNCGAFVLADFKRVMESLPALMDLKLAGHQDIPPEAPSYLTTISRLRKLSIARGAWASPSVTQDILCSMPNLEVFVADALSDIAIREDPRPWVCTDLRELTVSFYIRSGPPFSVDATIETMMLDRLSQLEKLERLQFPSCTVITSPDGWGTDPFRIRMEFGLDRLKTLKRLQSFEAPVGQWWTETEARWVLKNWTQLKELDIHMDPKAKELLSPQLMKKPIEDVSFKF